MKPIMVMRVVRTPPAGVARLAEEVSIRCQCEEEVTAEMAGDEENAERARGGRRWRMADGSPIACQEKLRVLEENLSEIRQVCQDAFEDALLMGCDEEDVRRIFASIVGGLTNPFAKD
jgi:hypothetical protein